ncbi:MAG: nucleotide exchange factor GrpE [Saprospiraceae bacterium]|nr:nucleotide exchange factor GrpE [Saprospiraceae bacterium]
MADETKPDPGEVEANTQSVWEKSFEQLSSEFESFKSLIKDHLDRQIEQNRFKDETIDRLQKIVNEYEKGFIEKIREPLLMDIIFFKDSFDKFKDKFEESADTLIKEINMFDEELEEVLYANGITLVESDTDFYNREIQLVKKKIPTNQIEEDKRVAKILKKGYIMDNKILRKEEIAILVFEENPPLI